MPIENTPRSYNPSRSIHRSFAWTWRMCGPNSRMKRGMSIIWRIRWLGSKFSPMEPPHRSRIRRHIRGVVAMLLPPGHSSSLKSIGQFSIVIFRP